MIAESPKALLVLGSWNDSRTNRFNIRRDEGASTALGVRAVRGGGTRLQQSSSTRPGQGRPAISDHGWLGSGGGFDDKLSSEVVLLDAEVFLPLVAQCSRKRPKAMARKDDRGHGRLPTWMWAAGLFPFSHPKNRSFPLNYRLCRVQLRGKPHTPNG